MSESVEVPQATSPPQARKGFAARVIGVFMSPGETFEDIARRPTILAPLLFLFVVQAVFTYLILPAQGQDAALFTENSSFFQRLPEEQRAEIMEQQRNPSPTRRMVSAVAGPIVIFVFFVIFALVFWGVGNLLGGEPTFKKVLSMLLFAGMIGLVAGSLIKLPLIISKNTLAGVTFSPAMFSSMQAGESASVSSTENTRQCIHAFLLVCFTRTDSASTTEFRGTNFLYLHVRTSETEQD